jgi:hypothetical protein
MAVVAYHHGSLELGPPSALTFQMRLMEAVAGGMIEDHRRAVESYARFRLQTPVTEPSPGTLEVTCFAKPDNVTNTVVYRHGDSAFPIHRKENFAARTTLKPNTEYIIEHRSVMRDSTGALTENTVEKYYTDDTGTVTRVDTYAGVKGAWSPELNKPMPNVTYNVIAQVDGGLQNTFTLITDDFAKPKFIGAHITGTLKGDMNRNAWQQLLAGRRVGGSAYDGGHLIASLFGGPGESANLLAQHMFQNRGHGNPNSDANALAFYQLERDLFSQAQERFNAGQTIDLHMEVEAVPGPKPGLPSSLTVDYRFAGGRAEFAEFDNLVQGDM